jgi:dienelactone hydrolase
MSFLKHFSKAVASRVLRFARPPLSRIGRFFAIAWPGAAVGLAVAASLIPAYGGLCMKTGLGSGIDVGGALLLGVVLTALSILLTMLGLTLLRRLPRRFVAAAVAAGICVVGVGGGFGYSPEFAIRLAGPPVALIALAGAGLSVLLRRGSGRAGIVHGVLGSSMVLVAVVLAGLLIFWILTPGEDPSWKDVAAVACHTAPLDAPNPALPGRYEVGTLFYGSGTDRRRPEYGEKVDIKTDAVDASVFVTNLAGFKAWARKKYWGFEPKAFPLNARVWFPKGDGPFPLVLIVHGNHKMEEFSDPGYAYLGELLASRGYIVASVDENFLNGSWAGDIGDENDARGWLLLKHLELWRAWNEQADSPFAHKVDLDDIALIGHSRGGEAIVHAAAFNDLSHWPDDAKVRFDFHFSIRTLIAIAPIDGQYEPAGRPTPVENVNYLVLQGSHDSDLDFFAGARTYRRVEFTDDEYWMKAALYIYRANHGQFNAVWGPYDMGPPLNRLLNLGRLLKPEEQRTIAKVYISAFLDATLRGRSEYIPMFRNHRCAAAWLPNTVCFNRFEESDFHVLADFDESIDVTKASVPGAYLRGEGLSVWRLQEMKGRGDWPFDDSAVVLGWNVPPAGGPPEDAPFFSIVLPDTLPSEWQLDSDSVLSFCLADTDDQCEPLFPADPACVDRPDVDDPHGPPHRDDPNDTPDESGIDLTIELVASDGCVARLPLSHVAPLQPALHVTFTKWAYWEHSRNKSAVEPVLQTYEIPLSDFVQANPTFTPSRLREIRFRFDRMATRVLLLDNVGFASPPDSNSPDVP